MRLKSLPVRQALDTILMHNVADNAGGRVLRKGTRLTEEYLAQLAEMGRATVDVAVLEEDDINEDEAAMGLAVALKTEHMTLSRPTGGRVNLRAQIDGLLEVDVDRLVELNMIPGIGLGTRRQHAVVGPNQETDNIAALKIIPFAVQRQILDRALELAQRRPAIVDLRPFRPGQPVALLLVGEPSVHGRLAESFLPSTQARVERLSGQLVTTDAVVQEEKAIGRAAARLLEVADLLIIAGQTSIMDEDDTTLRALRAIGAESTLSGAPVEPGNLLALAYFPGKAVVCAPGSAQSLKRNVVDLVLPRLLVGDRLDRRDIAALGLGGFLTPAERGSAVQGDES
jgi:molybdenum cofactor cytidylyltransferase